MRLPNISVIVCCYNSAKRIEPTLKALAGQITDNRFVYEVILVDNKSSDQISTVAGKIWTESGSRHPLRIVSESIAGLAHARKKGFKEAKYPLICFCDDDNWLKNDYLLKATITLSKNEEIGALGGFNVPATEGPEPPWLKNFYGYFAMAPQWSASGDISTCRGWVYGAGMVLRKSAIHNLTEISFILKGRTGDKLSSSEDKEICYRVLLNGYKIYYDENLILTHFVAKEKLSLDYLFKLLYSIYNDLVYLDGLVYKSGAQAGWFDKRHKRWWLFRFFRIAINFSFYQNFRPISYFKIWKIHKVWLMSILKLRSKYDRLFLEE